MEYCINCGNKIEKSDKFCENCGEKVSTFSTEPSLVIPTKLASMTIKEKIMVFWIIVVFVSFVLGAIFSNPNNQPPLTQTVIDAPANTPQIQIETPSNSPITNPDYLADPNSFLVDKQDLVLVNFPANTPVWVEEVVSEAGLRISYPITVAGKKVFKIQNLVLSQLDGYSFLFGSENPVLKMLKLQNRYPTNKDSFISCIRQATVSYMKNTIKHQYVEVKYPSSSTFLKSYSGAGVTINGKDLVREMVANGFGIGSVISEIVLYSQEEQTAILGNAGMWGICLPKPKQ